ncbi:MAG TPA: macro domain-containing protein [Polyangiaceae bacterium]|nr:macro domain-containing protein [Polyangiaceae bacterium]
MPAQFTEGDLFAAKGIRAWAHGCNCAGSMGAGIAVEFKRRFPRMFDEYRTRCADGRFGLGDVFVWSEGEMTVYNLGTQEHWRKKAQLAALAKAVTRMVSLAEKGGVERIALPRIGSGLGGLDWPKVRGVLEEAGGATGVELVVFERYVPS